MRFYARSLSCNGCHQNVKTPLHVPQSLKQGRVAEALNKLLLQCTEQTLARPRVVEGQLPEGAFAYSSLGKPAALLCFNWQPCVFMTASVCQTSRSRRVVPRGCLLWQSPATERYFVSVSLRAATAATFQWATVSWLAGSAPILHLEMDTNSSTLLTSSASFCDRRKLFLYL